MYLECLKIFLISEALRGFGSGFACTLQEVAMKTDKDALMKAHGRSHSASDWGNSTPAASARFGLHIRMSE